MRQVPPMHAALALGAVQETPHTPQFSGSSASTVSHSFLGSRSQSAVPGGQLGRQPAAPGSGASGTGDSLALSAETVTGTRAAQLPKPKRRHTACTRVVAKALLFTPH